MPFASIELPLKEAPKGSHWEEEIEDRIDKANVLLRAWCTTRVGKLKTRHYSETENHNNSNSIRNCCLNQLLYLRSINWGNLVNTYCPALVTICTDRPRSAASISRHAAPPGPARSSPAQQSTAHRPTTNNHQTLSKKFLRLTLFNMTHKNCK